jgi:hypothetical protein
MTEEAATAAIDAAGAAVHHPRWTEDIMRRSSGLVWSVMTVALLGSGCTLVLTELPVSSQPCPIDRDQLEGTWQLKDGAIQVRFSDDGIARLATLDWVDDHFEKLEGEMIVAPGREYNYVSLRGQERSDQAVEGEYLLAQYRITDGGELLLWIADNQAFERAIEEQHLAGTVSRERYSTTILVTAAPEALVAFLDDPDNGPLFDYTEPLVLRRIAAAPPAEEPSPAPADR